MRGILSTVATVATVAGRKNWGGILPPHLPEGAPFYGTLKVPEDVEFHDTLCPKTRHEVRSKSEGLVGIWPTHIARATVFLSSHKAVRVERFVPGYLKGNGALAYPLKAFAERAATE